VVRKTKEEALETRERLLDAAGRVFSEKGVTNTSLGDIAKSAGMTRGAIYWHFCNKTELMAALWDRTKMPLDETWGGCCPESDRDPLGRIRGNAIRMLQRAVNDEKTRQVYDILFHKCECVDEAEPIMARRMASRKECAPTIEGFFAAAIESGQLPAGLDPHRAMIGLFCFIEGLIYNSLIQPEALRLAEMAEHYVDTYIAGLKHAPPLPGKVPAASTA